MIFSLDQRPLRLAVARRHYVRFGYKNDGAIRYNSRCPGLSITVAQQRETSQEEGTLYETFKLFGTDRIIDGRLLLTRVVSIYSEAGGSLRPIQDGSER